MQRRSFLKLLGMAGMAAAAPSLLSSQAAPPNQTASGGWRKLGNGFILQWGSDDMAGPHGERIVHPLIVDHTKAVYALTAASDGQVLVQIHPDGSGFKAYTAQPEAINWISIGRSKPL